ncbi:MAG: serine hydrolase [Sarcina sp.]
MKKKFFVILMGLGIIGSFSAGIVKSNAVEKKEITQSEKDLREAEKKAYEKEQMRVKEEEERKKEADKIKEIVFEEAGEFADNIGFYYYNLESDAEYSLNPDKEFRAASTIKLPQAMLVMDNVHNGKLSFNTMMQYDKKSDYEGGTGSLQYRKNLNNVSIGEAVKLSITISDNIAYRMLKRNISMPVKEYIESTTGIKTMGDNQLTARQAMELLKRLYKNPDNNPHYDTLIGDLKNTVFHDSFDKYVPDENVAHKIGSYYRYYHDIGIVYSDADYILVMYTKDVGELPKGASLEKDNILLTDAGALAEEKQAKISKRIYELHNPKEEKDITGKKKMN